MAKRLTQPQYADDTCDWCVANKATHRIVVQYSDDETGEREIWLCDQCADVAEEGINYAHDEGGE
jgi:hypothetical protein